MKYIVGLTIGIALMVAWPQQTRQVFDHTLEYIEFGLAQVRQQIGSEKRARSSPNMQFMIAITLLSGVSDASFLSSLFLGMMSRDDYPQAYAKLSTITAYACYPTPSFQQYAHPYTGLPTAFPAEQKQYALDKSRPNALQQRMHY